MPSEVLVFRKRLESIEETMQSIQAAVGGTVAAAAPVVVDDSVIAELTKRVAELEAVPAPVVVDDSVIAELTKRVAVDATLIAELTERIAKLEAMNAPLSAEEKKGMGLEVAESDVEDSEAEPEADA